MATSDKATLEYQGKTYELPVVQGAAGERAIDIGRLKQQTGLYTFDPGFKNTAACRSRITYLDGDRGILLHRGYPIEYLAENHTFIEVAYLLIKGHLPSPDERARFSKLLNQHSLIHEDMRHFFRTYPEQAHPMAVLAAMVVSLSGFYPQIADPDYKEDIDISATRLISKVRTLAAFAYKKTIGEPIVYPRHDLVYCENFLNMMFSSPVRAYEIRPEIVRALNVLLILHADHEQNCSTTAVRVVGSSLANLYASVSAAICALWGPLHGGANQAVIDMLEAIAADGGDVDKYIRMAENPKSGFRLYGFGHRVYKTYDPRARIIRKVYEDVLRATHQQDRLLDVAHTLEERAAKSAYFVDRHLYPNVDFYSGLLYRAIGIPSNMFTVMFAVGRMPGWIANWSEVQHDEEQKIMRPRQLYFGAINPPTKPTP